MAAPRWLKHWSVISGAGLAVLTGAASATGALSDIGKGVRDFTGIATIVYVDNALKLLAGGFEPTQKKIDALSDLVADSVVRQLGAELDTLNDRIVGKEALIGALPAGVPGVLGLKGELKGLQDKAEQTRLDLQAARCARIKITSGVNPNCSPRL